MSISMYTPYTPKNRPRAFAQAGRNASLPEFGLRMIYDMEKEAAAHDADIL